MDKDCSSKWFPPAATKVVVVDIIDRDRNWPVCFMSSMGVVVFRGWVLLHMSDTIWLDREPTFHRDRNWPVCTCLA